MPRFACLLIVTVTWCGVAVPSLTGAQEPAPAVIVPERVLAATGRDPLPYDSVQVGMLTRVKAADLIYGRTAVLQARFGDTIVVRGLRQREVVRVPPDRIEWMEVSTGRGWTLVSATRGAVIGLGAGLVLSRVMQYAFEPEADREPQQCPLLIINEDCGMSPPLFYASVAMGVLGGAAIGGEIGGERWRVVRLP